MNLSMRWLREMIPGLEATDEEIQRLLADRGAPVEEVTELGSGLEEVVVGRVKAVREHPNADRLRLCDVEDGQEVLQVVCGAPVIEEGGYYPFAPVGTELPNGMELRKAKIRGEYSHGMLCSEKELGLGRDQSGIMQLHADGLEPGQSFLEVMGLDDLRVEIEVSPNRGDLLSHLGVAREVAPDGVTQVKLPPIPGAPELELETETAGTEADVGGVIVRIEAPEMCPRFLGVLIRDVEVGPSPEWLQNRLRAVGQQPINNVVDATNYILLELGNPMHAYDRAELEGDTVVVRYATDGEQMETLDGVERTFTSEMMMVCDAERPHDIAGIMGGEHSSVTEKTKDVFLEAALWVPANIRATRRALNLSTDASYRFERGVDPRSHHLAVERALQIILATAGGEVASPVVELVTEPFTEDVLELRLSRLEQVMGVPFTAAEVAGLLEPIGFECSDEGDSVRVTVPGYRSYDVTREIDLVEEVARTRGYNAFDADPGPVSLQNSVPDHPLFGLEDALRARLAGAGLLEVTNPAFAPEDEGEVELNNPISMEESRLRTSVLPAMIRNVEYNWARGARDLRFFELGTVFRAAGSGEPPEEAAHLGILMTGRDRPPHWDREEATIDVWTLRGLLETLLPVIDRDLVIDPEADASGLFDPGASFLIRDGEGRLRGRAGLVKTERADAPAWADPLWGAEITLPDEPAAAEDPHFTPLPTFPGVERDLALLVPKATQAATVVETIEEAAGTLLDSVDIFDLYEGEGVPDDLRSLAVRLRLQARDRTLKDSDADRVVGEVLDRLQEELGVEQRV